MDASIASTSSSELGELRDTPGWEVLLLLLSLYLHLRWHAIRKATQKNLPIWAVVIKSVPALPRGSLVNTSDCDRKYTPSILISPKPNPETISIILHSSHFDQEKYLHYPVSSYSDEEKSFHYSNFIVFWRRKIFALFAFIVFWPRKVFPLF